MISVHDSAELTSPMSYDFTFDLSRLSKAFFKDIAHFSQQERLSERFANIAHTLIKKFDVDKLTGMAVNDSIQIIQDLVDVNINNTLASDHFQHTTHRVLLLPHCCRKFMDSRCKANFDPATSSYICQHCSPDCLVHQSTVLAAARGYDAFILPGASCIRKIFQHRNYDGVIGVACTEELKLGMSMLRQRNIPAQGIPLIKNGCCETLFNFEILREFLDPSPSSSRPMGQSIDEPIARGSFRGHPCSETGQSARDE
jgi:uncharacterized protein